MSLRFKGMRFGKLLVLNVCGHDKYKNILWECICDCGRTCISRATDLRKGKKSCSSSCGHILDILGKRFGSLVATKVVSRNAKEGVLWECICDCGNTVVVSAGRLNSAKNPTVSCGCSRRTKNIIGRKFGMLTVTSTSFDGARTKAKCVCDCGGDIEVRASQLLCGLVASCGCLRRRKGNNNPKWRQDMSHDDRLKHRCRHYGWPELWDVRKKVYERDDYRCSCCGRRSSKGHPLTINAHHLESWCVNKDKRLDPDNMVSVCSPCHRLFHSLYGKKNTPIQFAKFQEFFVREN